MTEEHPIEYRIIPYASGYRVGTDGSVWTRLERKGLGRGKGVKSYLGDSWRKLSPGVVSTGRLMIYLFCDDRIKRRKYVHRLVLETFVGPCPPGMECRHFPDRDPKNCRLSNLVWGTKKQNQADRVTHGTDNHGSNSKQAKLTEEQVMAIRKEYIPGRVTGKQLGEKYGVSGAKIFQILARKSWSHVT